MTVATIEQLEIAKARIAATRGIRIIQKSDPATWQAAKPHQAIVQRNDARGVGWNMERIIESLGLTPRDGCHCKGLAAEMNRLGPDKCREHRSRLVASLRINAQRYSWGDVAMAAAKALTTGLAWKLDLTDVYGSLLDEAIRRTERDKGQ